MICGVLCFLVSSPKSNIPCNYCSGTYFPIIPVQNSKITNMVTSYNTSFSFFYFIEYPSLYNVSNSSCTSSNENLKYILWVKHIIILSPFMDISNYSLLVRLVVINIFLPDFKIFSPHTFYPWPPHVSILFIITSEANPLQVVPISPWLHILF